MRRLRGFNLSSGPRRFIQLVLEFRTDSDPRGRNSERDAPSIIPLDSCQYIYLISASAGALHQRCTGIVKRGLFNRQ